MKIFSDRTDSVQHIDKPDREVQVKGAFMTSDQVWESLGFRVEGLREVLDKTDERRTREYAKFLEQESSRVGISVCAIFDIVKGALLDHFCNYDHLIAANGKKYPIHKALDDVSKQAEEIVTQKTGVDVLCFKRPGR